MRLPLIAAAGLLAIGSSLSAEPAKIAGTASVNTAQAETPRAPIVLASVDTARATVPDSGQPSPAAVKRRIAPRVTTCRCGPPQVEPQPEDQ